MSIVKVDSMPFQFELAGGCNCCNCRGREIVYVNHRGEVEKFDRHKSRDHRADYLKSVGRIRQAIQNFLELNAPEFIQDTEAVILRPLQGSNTIRLRHLTTPRAKANGIPNSQRTARRTKLGYRKNP